MKKIHLFMCMAALSSMAVVQAAYGMADTSRPLPVQGNPPACSRIADGEEQLGSGYIRTSTGLFFASENGNMRIDFVAADIVRVRYTQEPAFLGNGTIVCVERTQAAVPFSVNGDGHRVMMATDSLQVVIDLDNWAISYSDVRSGKALLTETANPRDYERVVQENVTYDESTRRTVETADGKKEIMDVLRRDTVGHTWKYRNHFQLQPGEALYGLGSHMEDYMNLRGKTLYLCQHNLKAMIPVLNSTAGYGLLFDAGCSMIFSEAGEDAFVELEAAKEIDYYFMKGYTMDRVVAQYRKLTGDCPMLPKYMFGYIQSKERYHSSDEILSAVKEYRLREVPLDVIVQDWNYWPKGWGYMKMDPKYYPDPKSLADSIHTLNAKLMVSIWPNPSKCPQADDFASKGFMLPQSVYDAFNPLARRYYWHYANNEFFSKGFDAWWCDCTEPLDWDWNQSPPNHGWENHKERWQGNTKLLSDVLGAERSTLFSLYHSRGIYENQRLTTFEKRVVNLTRSSYAGQQRYGTITWNGDTHASWESFAQQIPAGLNFMASGCNYWTVDVGAFFTKKKARWIFAGQFNDGVKDLGYREFYTRMFQYATFLPILRSHGTDTPREIWNFGEKGEPFYDAILGMIHLRYKLFPYIYSLAGGVSHEQYTMTRMLAFDFPDDSRVLDLKDQFMFGPAFLVCPVTMPMYYSADSTPVTADKSRNVYLPEGTKWVDFWTRKEYDGGHWIKAEAPIDRLPLFVRAGSIIPMGPVVQHTGECNGEELEINVYPGRDTRFTLYEDEGDSYRYEQGEYSRIEFRWDDKHKKLYIGQRQGSYQGMLLVRTFNVLLHRNGNTVQHKVRYDGKGVKCSF